MFIQQPSDLQLGLRNVHAHQKEKIEERRKRRKVVGVCVEEKDSAFLSKRVFCQESFRSGYRPWYIFHGRLIN